MDVLIVGAGISGIGAAARLQERCPGKTYAILETREHLGGTWDLFRYPGIRSDSDMYTLSFPFKPWVNDKSIADGPDILVYLEDTAREFGVDRHIHYSQKVVRASWDSASALWTVTAQTPAGEVQHTARMLYAATGYYDYDSGHVVDFREQDSFGGSIVHPQFWPEGLEVAGKRFVIIGSGATAVTLLPALIAQGAGHVVMLQRTPTYMLPLPGGDPIASIMRKVLPPKAVHRVVRGKNIAMNAGSFALMRRFPKAARSALTAAARHALPQGYPVDTHFNPPYDPWDQRLCVTPDSDLFEAISSGRGEVVTAQIECFDETGIRLVTGEHVDADVIITATGLKVVVAGKISVEVDGQPVAVNEGFIYKGLMLSDVPNLVWCVGYTNASWTLRSDLTARWFCKLLNHLDEGGWTTATPRFDEPDTTGRPAIELSAGYIQRALDVLPRQGQARPWTVRQNYFYDLAATLGGRIDDGRLEMVRSMHAADPHRAPGLDAGVAS